MKTKAHPAETFGHLLYTIRLGLMKRAQRLLADQGFDINFTHFRVLKQISLHEPMTAKDLARAVEHDGGALTRLLDRLQEKGFIVRCTNAQDRRAVDLSLTAAGRKVLAAGQNCVTGMSADVLSDLNKAEQEQLLSLLYRVRVRLDSLEDN